MTEKLTRKEIVARLSKTYGLQPKIARQILGTVLDLIVEAIVNQHTVELRDFGVFKIRNRKGKHGFNPKAKEPVWIPPHPVVKFQPGQNVKAKLYENARSIRPTQL